MAPSTIEVYPPEDTTYPDAAGVPITATGAIVDVSKYILDAVRYGYLLTNDPLDIYQPDDRTGTGADSGGLTFADMASMRGARGSFEGQVCALRGYYLEGDGGGGDFFWEGASTVTPDDGLVVGSNPTGRWIRLVPDAKVTIPPASAVPQSSYINVKWFGAKGDFVTNDGPAIQRAILALRSFGAELFFPEGTYCTTQTIQMRYNEGSVSPFGNVLVRGQNYGAGGFAATKIQWIGSYTGTSTGSAGTGYAKNDASVLWQAGTPSCMYQDINFTVGTGFRVGCLVNMGQEDGQAAYLTRQTFERVGFQAEGNSLTSGADFCVALDFFKNQSGNNENHRFVDCGFSNPIYAAVWVRDSTQSYNMSMEGGNFGNYRHSISDRPYGVAFLNDSISCDFSFKNIDFQRVATHLHLRQLPQSVVFVECSSEQFKKIVYAPGFQGNNLGAISILGGRYSGDGQVQASEGPLSTFGAADYNFVDISGDFPFVIKGVSFGGGYFSQDGTLKWDSNDLTSEGNHYHNTAPFNKTNGTWVAGQNGRTFSRGDNGQSSGQSSKLPTLEGCLNPSGSVTISDAATSANVTFTYPEPSTTFAGVPVSQDYNVSLHVVSRVGAAAVTAPFASAISATGFTINVPTAPGAGTSVTIRYELSRH